MPDISLKGDAKSPPSEFTVRAQQKKFPTSSLNNEEASILQTQMNQLMAPLESSELENITKDRAQSVAFTAAFAKQVFDEKRFGGVNAQDNEIGVSPLRPGHIRADPSTGNAQNDWYYQPGSTGWNDYIGDGSTNNYTVTEDQVSIVFALVDQDTSTEISGVNVDSFGRNVDMLPQDMNDSRLMDNETEQMVMALPTLIAQENDDIHIRLRHDRDTESQPRLFGFTFGLGSFLNTEDY